MAELREDIKKMQHELGLSQIVECDFEHLLRFTVGSAAISITNKHQGGNQQ